MSLSRPCLHRGLLLVSWGVAFVLWCGEGLAQAPAFAVQDAQVTYGGVRGGAFLAESDGTTRRSHGVSASTRSLGTVTQDGLTVHRDITAALGYGSAGLVGEVGGVVRGGYRFALAPTHGPFVRGGVRGFFGGNDIWFHSHLELPHAQLGYQLLSREILLEVAAAGGLSLLGHYQAGDGGERPLSLTPVWGSELALHHRPVRLDIAWLRFQPSAYGPAKGPLDRLDATICLSVWRLGLCNQLRYYRGNLATEEGLPVTDTQALSASLMIGFTSVRSKHDVRRCGPSP